MLVVCLSSTQQLPGNSQVGLACYVSVCWVPLSDLSVGIFSLPHPFFPLSPSLSLSTFSNLPLLSSQHFSLSPSPSFSALLPSQLYFQCPKKTLFYTIPIICLVPQGKRCLTMDLSTEAPYNLTINTLLYKTFPGLKHTTQSTFSVCFGHFSTSLVILSYLQ